MSTQPPANRPDHPAFLASCALGGLGMLLLLIGALTGIHAVLFCGVGAGVGSLLAALAWRADLVAGWRQEHPRGRT